MNQDAKTIIDAGAAIADVKFMPGAIPFAIVPEGYKVADIERLMDDPVRKRGKVTMHDDESYIEYANKHGEKDFTTHYVLVDYEGGKFGAICVINEHGNAEPKWRDHTAEFTPRLAVEWERWKNNDRKKMSQSEFAAFLEDNIADINGSPSGTDMLAMALNFEQTSEKRFKRRIDLGTGGVQLGYVDKADDTTSAKIKMFERFQVAAPVFMGSNVAYPIDCRLKYRQSGDALSFWYELVRPDRVFRQATAEVVAKIKEKTGFMTLYGLPGLRNAP